MNKHIGSSFRDYLEKRLTSEEIQEIDEQARKEVERLRKQRDNNTDRRISPETE